MSKASRLEHGRTTRDWWDFKPRPMVSWFRPPAMLRVAFEVVFAGLIARYVDRRETQAIPDRPFGRRPPSAASPSTGAPAGDQAPPAASPFLFDAMSAEASHLEQTGVWVDYVSDFGDGWPASYPTARLFAAPELLLSAPDAQPGDDPYRRLPRADILILGGDNVYPTPARDEYRHRLIQPLAAALPEAPLFEAAPPETADAEEMGLWQPPRVGGRLERPRAAREAPLLLAIPGNHDWYDGLSGFLSVFCQERSIGAWQTRQLRSYFALRMPGNWEIWANDSQLSGRLDGAQLNAFAGIADQRVPRSRASSPATPTVLITAKPGWVEPQSSPSYRNFWFFERQMRRRWGHDPRLVLAGDFHAYARYQDAASGVAEAAATARRPGAHRILCGAGGSYLRGTHVLPDFVRPPENESPLGRDVTLPEEIVRTRAAFPSPERSRLLTWRALLFPFLWRNQAFCLMMSLVFALSFWNLRSGGTKLPGISATLTDPSYWDRWRELATTVQRAPMSVTTQLVLVAGLIGWTVLGNVARTRLFKLGWATLHAAAQVTAAFSVLWLVYDLVNRATPRLLEDPSGWRALGLIALASLPVGYVSGMLLGVFLFLSDRLFGLHSNEVFSAQALPHYRSFLRMHFAPDGQLTVYVIGIERVPKRWRRRIDSDLGPYEARFEPVDSKLRPRLIDGPLILHSDPAKDT